MYHGLIMKTVACFLTMAMLSVAGTVFSETARRPIVLSPMGDSLTQGNAWTAGGVSVCYRKTLASSLWAAGYAPRFQGAHEANSKDVIIPGCTAHSGFSGWNIQKGLGRAAFEEHGLNHLAKAPDAQAVLFLCGTNDLDVLNDRQGAAEQTFTAWQKLLKQWIAARPEVWFVVSTVPHQNPEAGGHSKASIDAFNASVRALFATKKETLNRPEDPMPIECVTGTLNEQGRALFGANAKIVLADLNLATPAGKTYFSTDRLHPTQPGQDRWAAVWQRALEHHVIPHLP